MSDFEVLPIGTKARLEELEAAIATQRHFGGEHSMAEVETESADRGENGAIGRAYRFLTEEEKAAMQEIKDLGRALLNKIETLGASRELSIATTKTEEAVMWAVKHITP